MIIQSLIFSHLYIYMTIIKFYHAKTDLISNSLNQHRYFAFISQVKNIYIYYNNLLYYFLKVIFLLDIDPNINYFYDRLSSQKKN